MSEQTTKWKKIHRSDNYYNIVSMFFFKKEDKTQIYHQIGCWLLSKVRKNVILDVFVQTTFEKNIIN